MSPYAKALVEYVQSVSAKEFDAEGYLDTYLPDWRGLNCAPKAKQHVVISPANEDK